MPSNTRILVVDDDATSHEVLRELLSEDYEVLAASHGNVALQLAAQHRPAIVLLDVVLPHMDGYEVCRRLRRMEGMANACIIMVSAKAMAAERECGFHAGADAYIAKPFDYAHLLDVIRTKRRPPAECSSI